MASAPAGHGGAQAFRRHVDQHDGEDDHDQDGADIGVVEFSDRLEQVLADPAGANEPHHGGAADLDFKAQQRIAAVSYTHLRAHETVLDLVCRLLLAQKTRYNNRYSLTSQA